MSCASARWCGLALLLLGICACGQAEPSGGDAPIGDGAIDDAGSADGAGSPTVALFRLEGAADDDLFEMPYPNDLRRRGDGTIELLGLVDRSPPIVQRYLEVLQGLRGGFSSNGAVFFRFSGPIDPASLPSGAIESQAEGASARLVDIDPASLEYGRATPLQLRFSAEAGKYIGAHHLALLPVPGFGLRANTRYAAILTDKIRDSGGRAVVADADFLALLEAQAPAGRERAHAAYAPLRDFIGERGLSGVVSAAVFTTGAHTALLGGIREVVEDLEPPVANELVVVEETARYWTVEGRYDAPNFQAGVPPFHRPADGGEIEIDVEGQPLVARGEAIRFALALPKGQMPEGGWPLVLYAHGTGGHYRTFIDNGIAQRLSEVRDDAGVVARLATVSIDQTLHGARNPDDSDPALTFVNLENPTASIFNVVQGAADNFSLLRAILPLQLQQLPRQGGGSVDFATTQRFDPQRLAMMGHSQGGLTGTLYLARAPEIKGAVLSGAGGQVMLEMLSRTDPVDFRALLGIALQEDIDLFHPIATMIEQLLEPSDPANYAPSIIRHPVNGAGPKHIFHAQGLSDPYTTTPTSDALAVALGVPQLGPVLRPVAALGLRGLAPQSLPASGNLTAIGGQAVTAGMLQYDGGHYVVFEDATAARQSALFLATLARDGTPTIFP